MSAYFTHPIPQYVKIGNFYGKWKSLKTRSECVAHRS